MYGGLNQIVTNRIIVYLWDLCKNFIKHLDKIKLYIYKVQLTTKI